MNKKIAKRKKALKKLIDKNRNQPRLGLACMIAPHPAMKKDIGKPIIDGRG